MHILINKKSYKQRKEYRKILNAIPKRRLRNKVDNFLNVLIFNDNKLIFSYF